MRRRLLLLLATLVLSGLVLEAAARLLFPVPPDWREPQIRHRESPLLGWALPAGVDGAWTIDAPVRTNAHGLRDDPFPRTKPPGELRVLALGDSFTFALGVRFEDLWVQQLERRLAARRDGPVQVINAGVAGYNTRQELVYLLAEGLAFEPDAVVVAFYWNDLLGNGEPLPALDAPRVARDGRWHDAPAQHLLPDWLRAPLRDSVLLYQLVQGVGRVRTLLDPPESETFRVQRALLRGESGLLEPYWQETARRLLEIHEAAAARDVPVVLMAFPMENQVRHEWPALVWGKELAQLWAPTGMPFVDLEPAFRRALEEGRNPFLPYDLHPSAEGMRIAAEALLPALRRVLERPAAPSSASR